MLKVPHWIVIICWLSWFPRFLGWKFITLLIFSLRLWRWVAAMLYYCRYARCTRSVSIGKLSLLPAFSYWSACPQMQMHNLAFSFSQLFLCNVVWGFCCMLQFPQHTMPTLQHSELVSIWSQRHQTVVQWPVELLDEEAWVEGSVQGAHVDLELVLLSDPFLPWRRMSSGLCFTVRVAFPWDKNSTFALS